MDATVASCNLRGKQRLEVELLVGAANHASRGGDELACQVWRRASVSSGDLAEVRIVSSSQSGHLLADVFPVLGRES